MAFTKYNYGQFSSSEQANGHRRIKSPSQGEKEFVNGVMMLTDAKDHSKWSKQMKDLLMSRCMWTYTGIEANSNFGNPETSDQTRVAEGGDGEATKLRKIDAKEFLMYMMNRTVSEVLKKSFEKRANPREMWEALRKECEPRHLNYLMEVRDQISRKKPSGTNLAKWIQDFENRVNILNTDPNFTIAAELMGEYFLQTLPKEYDTAAIILRSQESQKDWRKLCFELTRMNVREETLRVDPKGKGFKVVQERETRKCYSCGEIGHLSKNCNKKRIEKCAYCERNGHSEAKCRLKKRHQESTKEKREEKTGETVFKVNVAPPRAKAAVLERKPVVKGGEALHPMSRHRHTLRKSGPAKKTVEWTHGEPMPSMEEVEFVPAIRGAACKRQISAMLVESETSSVSRAERTQKILEVMVEYIICEAEEVYYRDNRPRQYDPVQRYLEEASKYATNELEPWLMVNELCERLKELGGKENQEADGMWQLEAGKPQKPQDELKSRALVNK